MCLKSTSPNALWNIEHLVIYIGMQRLLHPPTKSVSILRLINSLSFILILPIFGSFLHFSRGDCSFCVISVSVILLRHIRNSSVDVSTHDLVVKALVALAGHK